MTSRCSASRAYSTIRHCAFVANLPRTFLDQKEQDRANLKKRSQRIGLRLRCGQDAENATVIGLMKTAAVETVASHPRVSRTQIPSLGSGGLWRYTPRCARSA